MFCCYFKLLILTSNDVYESQQITKVQEFIYAEVAKSDY